MNRCAIFLADGKSYIRRLEVLRKVPSESDVNVRSESKLDRFFAVLVSLEEAELSAGRMLLESQGFVERRSVSIHRAVKFAKNLGLPRLFSRLEGREEALTLSLWLTNFIAPLELTRRRNN